MNLILNTTKTLKVQKITKNNIELWNQQRLECPGFCGAKFCAKFNGSCKIYKIRKNQWFVQNLQKMQNLQNYTKKLLILIHKINEWIKKNK